MDFMTIAQPVRSRFWLAYVLAVAMTVLEVVFLVAFVDALQNFPFLLPVTTITLVAFFCGTGPALLTTALSELFVQYYVVPPYYSLVLEWPNGYIGVGFYLSLCTIIIALMHGVFGANTALRTTEVSLQRLNEELEQRVVARTADLVEAQDELRHTNQNLEGLVDARVGELRVANDEIQRFAYIVSHDLRAPLVNILGFTSELDGVSGDLASFLAAVEQAAPTLVTPDRRTLIQSELPEALGFIRSSTTKMDRLINAILKMSREGRRKLTPEPIDLGALVAAQGETLSQQLSARQAELIVEGALPPLTSDRLAIEQIFGNLIENAVKYLTSARPGRIVVSGRTEGRQLHYAIADNGRGIDAKDFERIFELFRRSGEQDTVGEGIGLAYVRNLVRRLGGEVRVESVFGEGSTFTVTLPTGFRALQGTEV